MQLILLGVFAFLIPSAYGGCHCQFPAGSWTGNASFVVGMGSIDRLSGKFFAKFNNKGTHFMKADLINTEQFSMPTWNYYVKESKVRVCKPSCTDVHYDFFKMPNCVSDDMTEEDNSDSNIKVYTYSMGIQRRRYEVTMNDDGTCNPLKIYRRASNEFNYENIKRDKKRPASFYAEPSNLG